LLGWTTRDLAHRAGVCIFSIKQIEQAVWPNAYPGLARVKATLQSSGIMFLEGDAPEGLPRKRRKAGELVNLRSRRSTGL
jgi:hypothetical protein